LPDTSLRIADTPAFELYSKWSEPVENSDLFENLDSVVLELNARTDFSYFRRPLMEANGPSALGQHDGEA
jgi:hypothetical protein